MTASLDELDDVDEQQAAVGYVELVRRNRRFRLLWFGDIISLLGDWFNLIASATLVATLTQSGLAVGGLFVVRMLAPFLVSPVAGVVADRYNRKHILIIADIIRAITLVGFLFVRDAGDIWLLYTLSAIQLGVSGFFFPTRNALLPDIVSERELGTANALGSTTWSTMLALGAAIGGLVSGTLGIYPAFIIDAVTFLVSALFIVQIAYEPPLKDEGGDSSIGAALQEYLDGLRYLVQHGHVFIITMHKAAIGLTIGTSLDIVQVAIAEQVFVIGEGGSLGLGLMFGVTGIGTGLSPIITRYFTGDKPRALKLAIIGGYLLGGVGLITISMLTNFQTTLVGLMLRGMGGGLLWTFSTQLLLQLVPNRVRGRIFATEFAFFTLTSAIGSALTGQLLDRLTISQVAWAINGLLLLPLAVWTAWVVVNPPMKTQGN